MKRALFFFALAALLGSTSAAVLSDAGLSAEQLLEKYFDKKGNLTVDGSKLVEEINAATEKLPGSLSQLFGNERIDFRLKLASQETKTIGVVTSNSKITEANARPIPAPSFIVSTDEATARKILLSEQPMQEASNALKNKKVEITAVGWKAKITLWLFMFLFETTNSIGNITAKILLVTPW